MVILVESAHGTARGRSRTDLEDLGIRPRARLADAINKLHVPAAPTVLLTDSALMRSVMTAFSWLFGREQRMKAASPAALAEALHWLDIALPPELVQRTLQRIGDGLAGAAASTRR